MHTAHATKRKHCHERQSDREADGARRGTVPGGCIWRRGSRGRGEQDRGADLDVVDAGGTVIGDDEEHRLTVEMALLAGFKGSLVKEPFPFRGDVNGAEGVVGGPLFLGGGRKGGVSYALEGSFEAGRGGIRCLRLSQLCRR